MHRATVVLSTVALTFVLVATAKAQNAVIVYDHSPAQSSSTLPAPTKFFYPRESDIVAGVPSLVELPVGASICLRVKEANWVLYKYAVKVDTVKTPEIPGMSDFLGALTPILQKSADASVKTFTLSNDPSAGSYDTYVSLVKELTGIVTRISRMRLLSDSLTMAAALDSVETMHRDAQVRNAAADLLWSASSKDFPPTERDHIRTAQLALVERATGVHKEFVAAAARSRDDVCVKVSKDRVKATFSITAAAKPPKGDLARPQSNELFVVEVQPVPVERVRVSTGIIGGFVPKGPRFQVVNDTVRADSTDRDFYRPGVFLQLRPWAPTWLYATLGVTTGKQLEKPDLFLGLSARTNLGGLTGGFSAVVGAGYVRTAVVDRLTSGTTGAPLPSGVKDLEKLVGRSYRGAFGLFLSISGLELKK